MEINELRYFVEAAKTENVNRAGENLAISPGSISKAIARLEAELGTKLFSRVGRNIRKTSQGSKLEIYARQILDLEANARSAVGGESQEFQVVICGEEFLLSHYGVFLAEKILNRFTEARIRLNVSYSKEIVRRIGIGEAHIGLTTEKPPTNLAKKILGQTEYRTCVGPEHPLYKRVKKTQEILVNELVEYPFAVPQRGILGQMKPMQSEDGWRDDRFPRQRKIEVESLKLVEALIRNGSAVAYLPHFIVEELNFGILTVKGCPYYCQQKIYQVCKDPKSLSWLNQIW